MINSFVNILKLDQQGEPQMHICLDTSNYNQPTPRETLSYKMADDIFHKLQSLPLQTSAKDITILNLIKLVPFFPHLIPIMLI